MDYETAAGIIAEHQRNCGKYKGVISKVDPCSKKLQNETWLRYNAKIDTYRLEIFGNSILEFSKGGLYLNDHGWFSRTTHIRLNEYMPKGFRIYTHRLPYLTDNKCLGFIKSPCGTYPYNLPVGFFYDGKPTQDWYTRYASEAIAKLSRYVDENLNRLLGHGKFELERPDTVMLNPDAINDMWSSRGLATCITEDIHLAYLAQAAVDHAVNTVDYNGIFIDDIIKVLLISGHDAFKSERTIDNIGQKMECTLRHKMHLPTIPSNWIRKTLRPLMLEYIVDKLGFARSAWNRRG